MLTFTQKIVGLLVLSARIGISQPVAAQTQNQPTKTTWTLPECIDYALQNNLRVKQSQLDAKITDISINQARA
ncbi:MAG: Transporter, partial [Adhaeribacter sp.]|nr:Transporter [Adhaeribacter sp.]